MERLTDCAQGYCEMYCKKYLLCFEAPEDCIFKDVIKLYDALKRIEGMRISRTRSLKLRLLGKSRSMSRIGKRSSQYGPRTERRDN